MATPSHPVVARIRGFAAVALIASGLAALLAACASPAAASRPAAATTPATEVHLTCSQVSAVLSDGPDPAADPVGYAEAQILPLGQIRTPDPQLRAAISQLARAYQEFFDSHGTLATAKTAVASASKRIDSFCPGATS
jgi:hypothetical protein